MRRTLLLFTLCLILGYGAQAQCTPNPASGLPVDPLPTTQLADGDQGVAYSAVITVMISDTLDIPFIPGLPSFTVPVNSFTISGMTGLPPGLMYDCSLPGCVWMSGDTGCVEINGMPTADGFYDVGFVTGLNVEVPPGTPLPEGPTDVPLALLPALGLSIGYSIQIGDPIAVQDKLDASAFELAQNFPNPATQNTSVFFTAPSRTEVEFSILNLLGNVVKTEMISARQGVNEIEVNTVDMAPGVYFYSVSNGEEKLTKRMIVLK